MLMYLMLMAARDQCMQVRPPEHLLGGMHHGRQQAVDLGLGGNVDCSEASHGT